jgi:predicted Zn-dependent protease
VATAERFSRVKYAVASRVTLGASLVELSKQEEAVQHLRRAVADAEQLGHPPSIWTASAALARALERAGDDDAAEEATAVARSRVEGFAAGLSPTRRERFLASPYLEASFTAARR